MHFVTYLQNVFFYPDAFKADAVIFPSLRVFQKGC